MLLKDYHPQPRLVTPTTTIDHPRFPVIDAHNHLAEPFGGGWDQRPLAELLEQLDQAGVMRYVDLDGGWGQELFLRHLDIFKEKAPDRFLIFTGIDWSQWAVMGDDFPQWAARQLENDRRRGADGLKVWKDFGLHVVDQSGQRVHVDDRRLDPIWQTAAELDLPS